MFWAAEGPLLLNNDDEDEDDNRGIVIEWFMDNEVPRMWN